LAVLPTFDMLLFGATGDLVTRKLLPALYRRHAGAQISAESRIYGIARTPMLRAQYVAQAEAACKQFLGTEFNALHWGCFSRLLDYLKVDAAAETDYAQLSRALHGRDEFVRVFFFSTASNLFAVMCKNLALDLGETFKTRSLDAYERLLMDTVKGNLTLFMRRDELDAAWRWIDPIIAGWEQYDEPPKAYTAGTWGPAASSALVSRDGYAWHDEL